MGVRAVTTVADLGAPPRRFYAHWASPDYQIPHLADFVTWTDETGLPLNCGSFQRYAAEHPNTLPVEDVTDIVDDEAACDLDYRYHLTLAAETRWLKLVVRDMRQHGRAIQTIIGRPDLYATAANLCEHVATRAEHYMRRSSGAQLPDGDPNSWRQAALEYRRLRESTAIRAADANLAAQHTPAGPAEPYPSLTIAGVLVLAYLDDTATLNVSIDLDEAADWLPRADATVPIRVFVAGTDVYTTTTRSPHDTQRRQP